MFSRVSLTFILVFALVACDRQAPSLAAAEAHDLSRDYFTFANTRAFVSRHLELELTVDFDRQQLRGSVIHHMERLDPQAQTLVLDSRGLKIESVNLQRSGLEPIGLEFELGQTDPVKGEALVIGLPPEINLDSGFQLSIEYTTGPQASAIMWLPADMTAGGQHPFMFTQSQPIHARSWVPLQDSPSIRMTYEATIHTPPDLLAVMSADNDPDALRNGEYRFNMPQPIPSYLLALAVGNLFFEPFGPSTGVYAEPEILPAAAWEFADTQAMLDQTEELYGPYRWDRYDLLVLPPSFPFGGMENPRLSFITPSVLAGDRSLVSLIAHELAHSWSGNMVSNLTWRDIWLNEGTTSYLEARLMEVLYGKERADEERLLMYRSLLEDLETVPLEMQALAPVFETGNPDEGQQGMQYAKGQLMLEHLEAIYGREVFDAFMTAYFDRFAFQAISTEQFLQHIDEELLKKHPGVYSRAQVEEWLYQPGLPPNITVPTSVNLDRVTAMASAWSIGELPALELPVENWSPQAVVWFIKALPSGLTQGMLQELDEAMGLSTSTNAEIAQAWFTGVAQRRFKPAYPAMEAYLGRYGRTKLIKPVYGALVENGQDAALAQEIFAKQRHGYHPLTVMAIEPVLVGSD
jgi:leukotriene-A4 hydrolase